MSARTGLVLMGGGARAAYQAGVLAGIADVLRNAGWAPERNPFPIICGTSAGAINGAALAAGSGNFARAVDDLVRWWDVTKAGEIYRTDAIGALGNAAQWVLSLAFGWLFRVPPQALFDNRPLHQLLEHRIDFGAIGKALANGSLESLAITVSSYTSGQHVTFFESNQSISPWYRSQRGSYASTLTVDHLMASAAIPFLFPAVQLPLQGRSEFFGDGSMRQTAPVSPAIHLGADRLLVIGAGQVQTQDPASNSAGSQYHYPSVAQIAGHAMASIFLDALATDIERLKRINDTLMLIPRDVRSRSRLRPLKVLLIAPRERLDTMARPYIGELPRSVRLLLSALGATERRGSALVSYLLFEPAYTSRLIDLGRIDALSQRDELLRFFED